MMKNKLLLFVLTLNSLIYAQGYTSYFTGNPNDVVTTPTFGVCMMGGSVENDEAMKWLLQRANGGDVVVLRSSGSNGYNNYFYSELGVTLNSVETLVITSVAGATHPYVLDKVSKAELIWFAGGDQANYVNFFKNNALEDLLNQHINVKNAPIGGTSAGMAILGSHYFAALNGSVTTTQAINNPFHPNVTIGANDFLEIPFLSNVITDTHYNNPDRRGRHSVFMARIASDLQNRSFGIACNERAAVCFDQIGRAVVFGRGPQFPNEVAFFVQTNCEGDFLPETIQSGVPLTWNRNGRALKVYRVPGTMTGDNYFELSDWQTGVGGTWEHWSINNGVFNSVSGTPANCTLSTPVILEQDGGLFPNPFDQFIAYQGNDTGQLSLFDIGGRLIMKQSLSDNKTLNTSNLAPGMYIVSFEGVEKTFTQKLIKR
jgi:cyanophycinase-like exopeptidase